MGVEQQRGLEPVRIDLANACLWRGEQAITVTPKAFSVLRYLNDHPSRLVTKQELLDAVWPGAFVTDAVLKVCVREIRKALRDEARSPHFIETLHRRGYRLIAHLNGGADPTCESEALKPAAGLRGLIGRDDALAQLRGWQDQALAGQRQVVFVSGEVGIGKTAVVDAFVEQAAASGNWLVGRGQCIEQYSAGEAYSPVLEALSEICRQPRGEQAVALLGRYAPSWLAQLPWLNGAEHEDSAERGALNPTRERMLREMAELLEALTAKTPVLLVLEDLHWCDHSTVDLVSTLAQRRGPARLMLLITYRPVEAILAEHPLKSVRQDLRLRGCCEDLPLKFLSETDVDVYLAARFAKHAFPPELAGFIHRRTEGNPLFVVNVVDYLFAREVVVAGTGGWRLRGAIEEFDPEVPESLRQMIDRQVERYGVEEQRVLEAASVAGPEFVAAVVAAALALEESEAEEQLMRLAQRTRLLRDRGLDEWPDGTVSQRYSFVHVLYQDVLYQKQTAAQRVQQHLRIAERLERAYATGRTWERAAELALHFERGRGYQKAIDYLRQAAATATARYTHREAIGYLTHALDLVERLTTELGSDMQMTLLGQRGHIRRAMADMQGAADDFEALAACAREHAKLDRQAVALVSAAIALSWVDRGRCLAAVAELENITPRLDDAQLRAHAHGWSAYWHLLWRGWRNRDAHACAMAARAARRAADRRQLNLLLGRYSYFQSLRSRYTAASHTAEQAARLALQTGSAFEYLLAHFFWAWALLHAGEWGKTCVVLEEGAQVAEKNGHHLWTLLFRLELAWLSIETFDYANARELAQQGLKEAQQYQFRYGQLLGPIVLGLSHLGLAEYELAFEHFHRLRQRLAGERILMDWILRMPLYLGLSEYWQRQQDYPRARRDAGRLCAAAARPGERTYQALARRALAQVAMATGHWDDAEAEVLRALMLLEKRACPMAQWRVYATAAEYNQCMGRRAEADRYWQGSRAVLMRLADSLTNAPTLRKSLLDAPPVQEILCRSERPHEYTKHVQ